MLFLFTRLLILIFITKLDNVFSLKRYDFFSPCATNKQLVKCELKNKQALCDKWFEFIIIIFEQTYENETDVASDMGCFHLQGV